MEKRSLLSALAFAMCLNVALFGFEAFTNEARSQGNQMSISTVKIDVPHTISYQGVLSSRDSQATDGVYRMKAALYLDAEGSQSIWSDEFSVQVTGGNFIVLLGSGSAALPEPSAMNRFRLHSEHSG